MAGDIAINLEHVHAIFERWMNTEDFDIWDISNGRTVFTIDWGDLLEVYGAPFAALLEIIAEEEVNIIPTDAAATPESESDESSECWYLMKWTSRTRACS